MPAQAPPLETDRDAPSAPDAPGLSDGLGLPDGLGPPDAPPAPDGPEVEDHDDPSDPSEPSEDGPPPAAGPRVRLLGGFAAATVLLVSAAGVVLTVQVVSGRPATTSAEGPNLSSAPRPAAQIPAGAAARRGLFAAGLGSQGSRAVEVPSPTPRDPFSSGPTSPSTPPSLVSSSVSSTPVAGGGTPDGAGTGAPGAPTATVRPTGRPNPSAGATESGDGLVVVDRSVAVLPPPVVAALLRTFDSYVAGIDARDLPRAYAVYSASEQAANPYPAWSRGVDESIVNAVSIHQPSGALSAVGSGPVTVVVTFISRQPASVAANVGELCTRWDLVYSLVPDATRTGYLIDNAGPAIGTGHTAC